MSASTSTTTFSQHSIAAAPGGSFLLEERAPDEVFTPEDFSEEQRQIAATAERFARQEILPALDDIEHKNPGVLEDLMRKAAELGFAAIDIPEEYGGLVWIRPPPGWWQIACRSWQVFQPPSARMRESRLCRWSGTVLRTRSAVICPSL